MYSCRGDIDFSVPGSSRANRACSWAMSAWGDLWTFCVYKDKKKDTCSAARGIRLKDGSSGPPVLRTSEHPWGVPWASPRDKTKLLSANCLYKFFFKFLGAWKIPQTALCGACHASLQPWPQDILLTVRHAPSAVLVTHDKKTSFLCSHAAVSRMAIMCPICVFHEPWGQDASGVFNTSKEAEYPIPMCHGLCDVAEDVCMPSAAPRGSLSRPWII